MYIIDTEDDFIGPFGSAEAAYHYIYEKDLEGSDAHVEKLTDPDWNDNGR